MSFFFKEDFNLADTYQDGLDTKMSGNGVIYKEGGIVHIKTFEDSDTAFIISEEGLSATGCRNTPFRLSIRYRIDDLNDGDSFILSRFYLKETQPEVGDLGDNSLAAFIYNASGTLREYWRNYGAANHDFDGSTGTWSSDNKIVRTVSFNTWYTLTLTYHPDTGEVTLNNGVFNVNTDGPIKINDDLLWFLTGTHTTSIYGRGRLDYLYVEDLGIRKCFTALNSLTTGSRIKGAFDGSFISAVNDLTSRHRESLTAQNDILDYLPLRESLRAINRIGDTISDQRSYDVKIYLDGEEIGGLVESWEITCEDESSTKRVALTLRDKSILRNRRPYTLVDDKFFDPRISISVEGISLGNFFWEEAAEVEKFREFDGDIGGRSATAILERPFLEPVTEVFDEETTKRELAEFLAPTVPISWNILNSKIYADTYGVDGETPGEIIKALVTAGGGSLYTDFEDNLICDYKPFDTSGKNPVMSITCSEIVESNRKRDLPTGENSIEIFGFDKASALGKWPVVRLHASKTTLKSNGSDSLKLTAYCYNVDGSFSEVETIEHESATPSTPNEISVSKMIKRVTGIWKDVNGSPGDPVPGPFEFEGTTITTTEDMGNFAHLVTHDGGDTCSFSVDKLSSVDNSEVLIENGVAKTTMRASAGGGGYVTATATFKGQSDSVTINMDDPRVSDIDASADPKKIARGKTSTITCRVTGEEGVPVKDGMEVSFVIEEGDGSVQSEDAKETISSSHIIVGTSTGEIEGEEVTSTTEVDLSVRFPISDLLSIYRVVNGEEYNAVNYADGAEFTGKSITLDTPLPNKQTMVKVTYTSGGIAKTEYHAPSLGVITVEELFTVEPFTAYIRCTAGGEDALVSVDVSSPSVTESPDTSSDESEDLPWQWIYFPGEKGVRGEFLGTPSEEEYTDEKNIPKKSGYKIQVDNTSTKTVHENCATEKKVVDDSTFIILTVECRKRFIYDDYLDNNGKIHGKRWVKDKNTKDPIEGATVQIDWNNNDLFDEAYIDEEITTVVDGSFQFSWGVVGKHSIKIYHSDYETADEVITIPTTPERGVPETRYEYVPVEYYAKVRWRYKKK